ncbi:MAG: hypothetical protein VW491_03150 [Gammaproteobacteria bacterium]
MDSSFEERVRHHVRRQTSGEKAAVFRAIVEAWRDAEMDYPVRCPRPDARVDRLWFVRLKLNETTEDGMYCVVCAGGRIGYPVLRKEGVADPWAVELLRVEPASMLSLSDAHALTAKAAIVASHMNDAMALRRAESFKEPLKNHVLPGFGTKEKGKFVLDKHVWRRVVASGDELARGLDDRALANKFRRWGCYVLNSGEKMTTAHLKTMYGTGQKRLEKKRTEYLVNGVFRSDEEVADDDADSGLYGLQGTMLVPAMSKHPFTNATALAGVQPDNVYCLSAEYDVDVAGTSNSTLASHLGTGVHTAFDHMSVLNGQEHGRRETAVRIVRSLYPVAVGTGVLIHRHIESKRYGAGKPGRVTCMNFLLRSAKLKKTSAKEESYLYQTRDDNIQNYEKGEGIDVTSNNSNSWKAAIDADAYRTAVEIDRCAALAFSRFLPVAMRPDHVYAGKDRTSVLEIKTHWAKGFAMGLSDNGTPSSNTNDEMLQAGVQAHAVCTDLGLNDANMVMCSTRVPYVPNPTYVVHELYEGLIERENAVDRLKLCFGVVQSAKDMMVGCMQGLSDNAKATLITHICDVQIGESLPTADTMMARYLLNSGAAGRSVNSMYATAFTNNVWNALRVRQPAPAPYGVEPDSKRFTSTVPRNFQYTQKDRSHPDYPLMCFAALPARVTASLADAFINTAFDNGNRLPGVPLRGTFVQRGTSVAQTSREVSHAVGGVWRVVCAFIESDMNVPLFAGEAADAP